MMMRRVFNHAAGQILVTVNTDTGQMNTAVRADEFAQWSTPLECVRVDDEEGTARYPVSGREYPAG